MKKHSSIIPVVATLAAILLVAPVAAWAQGAVFVKNDNLGVGNSDPQEDIDLLSSDGDAQILVKETGSPVMQRGLMFLRNNGGVSFVLRNDATGQSWSFAQAGNDDFLINQQQSDGIELRLTPAGSLTIQGTLSQGSSRSIKDNFGAVDDLEVLNKVIELPLSTWSYQDESSDAVHLGPMAEDFQAAFSLGSSARHLAPSDVAGVALSAIKGLNARIESKDARITELEARLSYLETMVSTQAGR